jgi:hypothetical protein
MTRASTTESLAAPALAPAPASNKTRQTDSTRTAPACTTSVFVYVNAQHRWACWGQDFLALNSRGPCVALRCVALRCVALRCVAYRFCLASCRVPHPIALPDKNTKKGPPTGDPYSSAPAQERSSALSGIASLRRINDHFQHTRGRGITIMTADNPALALVKQVRPG